MDERNNDFDFDFKPIGQAIKKAQTTQGMTRDQLSRIVDYDPRHLQAIENEGQYPSLELFIQLVTMFNVSVDEYIFPSLSVITVSVLHSVRELISFISQKIPVSSCFLLSSIVATSCGLSGSMVVRNKPQALLSRAHGFPTSPEHHSLCRF